MFNAERNVYILLGLLHMVAFPRYCHVLASSDLADDAGPPYSLQRNSDRTLFLEVALPNLTNCNESTQISRVQRNHLFWTLSFDQGAYASDQYGLYLNVYVEQDYSGDLFEYLDWVECKILYSDGAMEQPELAATIGRTESHGFIYLPSSTVQIDKMRVWHWHGLYYTWSHRRQVVRKASLLVWPDKDHTLRTDRPVVVRVTLRVREPPCLRGGGIVIRQGGHCADISLLANASAILGELVQRQVALRDYLLDIPDASPRTVEALLRFLDDGGKLPQDVTLAQLSDLVPLARRYHVNTLIVAVKNFTNNLRLGEEKTT